MGANIQDLEFVGWSRRRTYRGKFINDDHYRGSRKLDHGIEFTVANNNYIG